MRALAALALALVSCAPAERRFPLRAPVWRDADMQSVFVPCRADPAKGDPEHVSCAPRIYDSPPMWDEADNLVFRPLSQALGIVASGESVDVNSLDEVPDSSWFTNRLGTREVTVPELRLGGCDPAQIIDPRSAADGTWIIEKGKTKGGSPGFRVTIPGKGQFQFKADDESQPEQSSAGSVIGEAAYHAAGYNTTCEQVVYFRPSLLKLMPGLKYRFGTYAEEKDFDQTELDRILRAAPHRADEVRMVASAWLPGRLLGPFRFVGTRDDDPNDVVPHEERRELRASRVLAAWLGHVDSNEQNSMDIWFADHPEQPDSSPGHVVHTFLDWGDCLGSNWPQEEVTRRMGFSYIFDWGDFASDFVTLGAQRHPWDEGRVRGHELFGYYDVERFGADGWKEEYPNPAFTRMTEHDAAWMARILARFTPEMVHALAEAARFTDPRNTEYVAGVLEGRLDRILERYLTRLSPVADLHVENEYRLCGVDLAEQRRLRDPARFRYVASTDRGAPLPVTRGEGGRVCVLLPRSGGPISYLGVTLDDGVARDPLRAYLYDLGSDRGYFLAGITR